MVGLERAAVNEVLHWLRERRPPEDADWIDVEAALEEADSRLGALPEEAKQAAWEMYRGEKGLPGKEEGTEEVGQKRAGVDPAYARAYLERDSKRAKRDFPP